MMGDSPRKSGWSWPEGGCALLCHGSAPVSLRRGGGWGGVGAVEPFLRDKPEATLFRNLSPCLCTSFPMELSRHIAAITPPLADLLLCARAFSRQRPQGRACFPREKSVLGRFSSPISSAPGRREPFRYKTCARIRTSLSTVT